MTESQPTGLNELGFTRQWVTEQPAVASALQVLVRDAHAIDDLGAQRPPAGDAATARSPVRFPLLAEAMGFTTPDRANLLPLQLRLPREAAVRSDRWQHLAAGVLSDADDPFHEIHSVVKTYRIPGRGDMPAAQAARMTTAAPAIRTTSELTAAEEARFHASGVVRLGRVVDEDELAALRGRIDDIMLGHVRYDGMMMQLDSDSGRYEDMPTQTPGFKGATLAYRKIEQLELDPLFRRYLQRPLIRSLATRLIGPQVSIYRSMFMNKPAGKGTVLPWHQDGGGIWRLSGQPLLTLWLALDPATRANGCVRVVPGSHHLGLLSEHGHTITAKQQRLHCPPERCEDLVLEPGELVLLHNLVLHASDINTSGQSRRAFSVCLMDGSIRSTDAGHPGFPTLFGAGALPPL